MFSILYKNEGSKINTKLNTKSLLFLHYIICLAFYKGTINSSLNDLFNGPSAKYNILFS